MAIFALAEMVPTSATLMSVLIVFKARLKNCTEGPVALSHFFQLWFCLSYPEVVVAILPQTIQDVCLGVSLGLTSPEEDH